MAIHHLCSIAYYGLNILTIIVLYGKKIKNYILSKDRFYFRIYYNIRNRIKGYRPVPTSE